MSKRSRSDMSKTSGPGPKMMIGKVVSVPRAVPQRARVSWWGPRSARRSAAPSELKFFDTAINSAVDATGEVPTGGQLVLIPQGDGESSRDGRVAYIKSIQGRYLVNSVPSLNANGSTNVFLYLVLDKQCNGAAAGVTDVMTSANLWSAFHNLANSDRFQVLRRWKVNLTSQANQSATVPSNINKTLEFYHRCDIPIQYSSTTGAITEIKSNNLFFLLGSDGQSDDTVTLTGSTRVRFYD